MRSKNRKTKRRKNRKNSRIFLSGTLTMLLIGTAIHAPKLYNSFFAKDKVVQAAPLEKTDNESKKEIQNDVNTAKNNEVSNKQESNQIDDKIENNTNSKNIDKTISTKNKNVNEEGLKYAIDRNEVANMLSNNYKSDGKKYVFLTFDDGPSNQNTADILDMLKAKDVKGTFFVVGENLKTKNGVELLKREYNEGHAIANHSYTHNFKKLYPGNRVNVDYFMKEVNETNIAMKEILGNDFDTKVLRMPGGYMSRVYYHDSNLNSLNSAFKSQGIASIDWNALNGDAEGKNYSKQDMFNYVVRSSNGIDKVVLLMHDAQGKVKTKELLPQVIDYFKSKGYEFKTIS